MAFITGAQYKQLADSLADARDTQILSKDFVFNAVYDIVLFQAIYPELDLLEDFWDAYSVETSATFSPSSLVGAVRSLQRHVIARSSYTSVDEYLWNELYPDKVQASFQTMSALAGYTISDMYVSL